MHGKDFHILAHLHQVFVWLLALFLKTMIIKFRWPSIAWGETLKRKVFIDIHILYIDQFELIYIYYIYQPIIKKLNEVVMKWISDSDLQREALWTEVYLQLRPSLPHNQDHVDTWQVNNFLKRILQISGKYLKNIWQISHKYHTNISQISHKHSYPTTKIMCIPDN